MDLNKIAALGLMSPQAVDKAKSDALTQTLFNIGSAFRQAGAPSRVPGGQPLNLAPVFQGYQNSLANSVKQALMLRQVERQEAEHKRKDAEYRRQEALRENLRNAMVPTSVTEAMTGQTAEAPSALMSSIPMSARPLARAMADAGDVTPLATALLGSAFRKKTPGVDVPYSPKVLSQLTGIAGTEARAALAAQQAAAGRWVPHPTMPGMQVHNVTGEVKRLPQIQGVGIGSTPPVAPSAAPPAAAPPVVPPTVSSAAPPAAPPAAGASAFVSASAPGAQYWPRSGILPKSISVLPPDKQSQGYEKNRERTESRLKLLREETIPLAKLEDNFRQFETVMDNYIRGGGKMGAAFKIPGARAAGGLSPDLETMFRIQDATTSLWRQGMPGSASDRDVAMFKGSNIGPDKSPETNRRIIKATRAAHQNAKDKLHFMEAWAASNFSDLAGAEEAWSQYLNSEEIFVHGKNVEPYTLNPNRKTWRQYFGLEQSAAPSGRVFRVKLK